MLRYFLFLFLLPACKSAPPAISPAALAYLEELLEILESRSVKRKEINWPAFRDSVLQQAKGAQSIADTYPAISYAVAKLGDGHSYFAAAVQEEAEAGEQKDPPLLPDEKTPVDIGYLRVRYCMGDEAQTERYIRELLEQVKRQDRPELKGWIIDLRGNFGGNMWPMLAGAGPILGSGIAGYNLDPEGNKETWIYSKGGACLDSICIARAPEFYTLQKPDPIVAVLTDGHTASSGEAMAVAFRGRPHTRSFGAPTFGVSTSNAPFELSDGSRLLLTVSVFADRHMQPYGKSVPVDQETDPAQSLEAAIEWIRQAYAVRDK